jgi:hypothetical protein
VDDHWRRGVYGLVNNFCTEACCEMKKSKVSPKWIRILWEIRCYIGVQGASDTLMPGYVETQKASVVKKQLAREDQPNNRPKIP